MNKLVALKIICYQQFKNRQIKIVTAKILVHHGT